MLNNFDLMAHILTKIKLRVIKMQLYSALICIWVCVPCYFKREDCKRCGNLVSGASICDGDAFKHPAGLPIPFRVQFQFQSVGLIELVSFWKSKRDDRFNNEHVSWLRVRGWKWPLQVVKFQPRSIPIVNMCHRTVPYSNECFAICHVEFI